MANDKKSRPTQRVAVKGKGKGKGGDGIPTVTVPVATGSAKRPGQARGGKGKRPRVQPSASSRSRSKKTKQAAKPKLDTPPVGMTPPPMTDTRPTTPPTPSKPRIVILDVQAPETGLEDVPASKLEEVRKDIPETHAKPVNGKPTPRTGPADANDRLVQGAQCTWIGYLSEAPDDPVKERPVCPHCNGDLITTADEATVQLGFEAFEFGAYTSVNPPPRPHPGYTSMMAWMRTQSTCWATIEAVAQAYEVATGNKVDPTR